MNTCYLKAVQARRWNWFRFLLTAAIVLFLLLILFVLHLFMGTFASASAAEDFKHIFTVIVSLTLAYVLLYVVYKVGMPILAAKSGKRQYDGDKILQKATCYRISADGLKDRSDSEPLRLRFDEIYKVMETAKYIFIYESDQAARIIPKRCFATEADLQAAVGLLKEHVPAKKYEAYKF
jgi:hypothetical protein